MLTYLINVTSDMLIVSVILGVIYAFVDRRFDKKNRIIAWCGLYLGIVIAGVRALITNTRRIVGGWRVGMYGYIAALAMFVIAAAALIVYFAVKRKKGKESGAARVCMTVSGVCIALLTASYLYCSLNNIFVYPFKFDTGSGILSTDYLFKLGGYLLGIVVCLLSAVSAYKVCDTAVKKGYDKTLYLALISVNTLYAVYGFGRLMSVMTTRKIIDSVELFSFSAYSNNHAHWYTYAAFIVIIVVCIVIWIGSFTRKEPYSTKAERRKQRALWRTGKRYSASAAVCFVMAVLCSTLFVKLNTVVIREAPVEEPVVIKDASGNDSELRVPLDMVRDGHLHRFGYNTPDGSPTRFIVVLKQENTNNYGIGLDACDICGEAGYYENNDGQVVCKKCNVVMNRSTIGMKGGCNPIIIDYDINESYITVPVEELIKNQSRFKK